MTTLSGKLTAIVQLSPDKIAMQIKQGGKYKKYTYANFYAYICMIAYALIRSGVKKGDKIAIVLENRPEWGVIYFVILFAGATAVPLDPQATPKELNYFLQDSASKIIFTSTQFCMAFKNINLQKIIILDEMPANITTEFKIPIIPFAKLYLKPPADFQPVPLEENDIASILYTSGTTGKPKGVMLSHKNFYANYCSIEKLKFLTVEHNILSILPLHHSFPFMVTLIIPLFSCNTITYVSSLKQEETLASMRDTGVTVLVGVPQFYMLFYRAILNKLKNINFIFRWIFYGLMEFFWLIRKWTSINLSKLLCYKIHKPFGKQLKFFACGGAKLLEDAELFFNKLGFTFIQGYGLTETSPIVTLNPLAKQRLGSAGKPIPDVEVAIIEGEVAISGANVMLGYYKNPAETAQALKENWFYSGDLGYLDKDGYLFLTGRAKELIVLSSGKNIVPEEVETYYGQSLFIKEMCVLEVGEQEHREEKLLAVIVPDFVYLRERNEVDAYGKIKWELEGLSKSYPAYKRIQGFIITKADLPRTRLGKLKRYEIKEQYLRELLGGKARQAEYIPTEQDLEILSSKLYQQIIKVLQEQKPLKKQIYLDNHLEIDLGFDSLSRVELLVALEKELTIKIPELDMAKVHTVRDLFKVGKELPATKGAVLTWQELLVAEPSAELIKKIEIAPGILSKLNYLVIGSALCVGIKLFWRLKASGKNNLPKNQPFILCANHASYLDGLFIAAALPKWFTQKMFYLGLSRYLDKPMVKSIVKAAHMIPGDAGVHLVAALQSCSYVLQHARYICVFPAGSRSIDGSIQPFKKGVGILAKELNIPLIPVYIKGSYNSWPRGKSLPRPCAITVIFGKPQAVDKLTKQGFVLGAKDAYDAIAIAIRDKVTELSR